MLYKVTENGSRTHLKPLLSTTLSHQGLLEKQMEQWLADNPTVILPEEEQQALVFSQEVPFENMTDVLAVDGQGNVLVIEVKRGVTPRDVIAQALEYGSKVAEWDYETLNLKAMVYFKQHGQDFDSLLDAFEKTFGIAPGDFPTEKFNLLQRLVIVSENVDPGVERTARWLRQQGVSLSCVSYTCYLTAGDDPEVFLDFQEVVRLGETVVRPKTRQTGDSTEEKHMANFSPDLLALYQEIKERCLRFGPDVSVRATRSYPSLRGVKSITDMHPRKDGFRLFVRPEGFNIPERGTATVEGLEVTRIPDSSGWTLNHYFAVTPQSDLDAVEKLLRRSYDAGHGRPTT